MDQHFHCLHETTAFLPSSSLPVHFDAPCWWNGGTACSTQLNYTVCVVNSMCPTSLVSGVFLITLLNMQTHMWKASPITGCKTIYMAVNLQVDWDGGQIENFYHVWQTSLQQDSSTPHTLYCELKLIIVNGVFLLIVIMYDCYFEWNCTSHSTALAYFMYIKS